MPFEGAVIGTLFAQLRTDMDAAIGDLAAIGDADTVAAPIETADIWFDVDGNGRRDGGEGLADVMGELAGFGALPNLTIQFDTADAAWLSAYAHLLAGLSELVLAVDPATEIDQVLQGRRALAALNAEAGAPFGPGFDYQFGDMADLAAIVIGTLEGPVDAARTQAAQAHWLAMVADNRRFWARVATETDNVAEWIPNKAQVSVLGLPFPPETGQRWLNVLREAEALLKGDVLLPHWRLADGLGIDLNALLQNPPELNLVGLVQGMDLLPYIRPGRLIGGDALWQFEALIGGNAGLYMVILN